jgi:hypothetical protein
MKPTTLPRSLLALVLAARAYRAETALERRFRAKTRVGAERPTRQRRA